MTQDERWMIRYKEIVDFIEMNHRNPSHYDAQERGLYCNWLKHNRKIMNAGMMKEERVALFLKLLELCDKYKHVNQYA